MPFGASPGRGGPKARARAGLSEWARKVRASGRRRSAGARFMRMGSSMATAMARVHTFKRVGEPLVIQQQASAGTRATILGNTNMCQSAGVSADQFLANCSSVRGAFRFALQQAANITEITNLFDNYRIAKVKLMFALSSTESTVSGASGAPMPIINYAYDPDDDSVPTSRTSVLENGYCQTRRMDRPFSITLTPRAQQSVVGGTGSAGGLLPTQTWLDCNSPAIYHYGLKWWIDQFPYTSSVDGVYGLTITPIFYIEAKNVI